MNRGIYAAANGMVAQQYVMDALANNLANINTNGFKQDVPTFRELHAIAVSRQAGTAPQHGPASGEFGTGSAFDSTATDLARGALRETKDPLDLALDGDGYFTVQTSNGVRLTRDGHFTRMLDGSGKASGMLGTDAGDLLLGAKGPISVGNAAKIEIGPDGTVTADGKTVDKLAIVTASPDALKKEGANLFTVSGSPTPSTAMVKQGFLEQSNVDPIRSMVKMITVQRAYEAMQKAIVTQDESLGKAVLEVARV